MNLLLTSVGRRTYMVKYFQDALKFVKGKVHASNSIYTYALSQADHYVLTPQIYEFNYIDFLIEYCVKNDISVIISLFDIDIPILAKNKLRFLEEGITVIVSDESVATICNDKWKTYLFSLDNNITMPYTYLTKEDLFEAINREIIQYPIIVKPRWGMGSIGIYKAYNEQELLLFYSRICREIKQSYLKFESQQDIEYSVIFQEYVDSQEFGIEIVNDLRGNYVTTFAKKKIAMRAGETDIAEIVDSSFFMDISNKISKGLGHISILDTDCFVTTSGKIYLLEMNCRFGGQYPFSHIAGANLPLQIIKWLAGESTDISLLSPQISTRVCKDLNPVKY